MTPPPAPEPPTAERLAQAARADPLAGTLARTVRMRGSADVAGPAEAVAKPVANVLQRNGAAAAQAAPAPVPVTPQTVQILYTQDHAKRAVKLNEELPEADGALITVEPKAVPGLTTLVLWGHGDAQRMCEITPPQMVTLIKKWTALNPTLHTVELLTCNARHYAPGKAKGDSYANRLKAGLKAGFRSDTRNLTIKALPTTLTGAKNAFSILLAEAPTRSWVYVTGPGTTDKAMMEGASLIKFEKTPSGGLKSFNGDIAARADKTVRDHPEREWTMLYGYFNTLRRILVVV